MTDRTADSRLVGIREDRAALDDAHEAESAVAMGGLERFVDQWRAPVDDLGNEGDVGDAERDGQGVQGAEDRPEGMGIGLHPHWAGGRGLGLGQAIDGVVEHHHRHVHVVTDGMDPVGGTDGEAVAVAGGDPHVQLRAAGLDAAGHRQGASMKAVEAEGAHVVGQPAGAADTGHRHRQFRDHLFVAQELVHRGEDAVVAAAGTPTRLPARVITDGEISLEDLVRPVRLESKHQLFPSNAARCFSRTR